MIRTDAAPQIPPALLAEPALPPAPLGLVFFGLTLLLFNLYNVGFFPLSPIILAVGIFYGAAGQIFVGVLEWRHRRIFGAVACTTFGLFWLSLIALAILPHAGIGELPAAAAMTAYSGIWCLFAGILMVGAWRLGRVLQVVFAAFFLYLLLQAIGASALPSLATAAGYAGILGGAAAIYAGIIPAISRRAGNE